MKNFKWPLLIDSTNKPSATLLFVYSSFLFAVGSIANLLAKDALMGAFCALGLYFGSFIFYRMRRLDGVKISLAEQSIELEDKPDEEKEDK